MPESEDTEGLAELKLRAEIAKLEAENLKLIGENSGLGKLARVAVPIMSGVITAFLGIIGITYEDQQSKARDQEVFLKLLELATKGENDESRIAGIGGLVQYWQGPFQTTVAQTLAATLMAEGPRVGQPLRMAAADAIGEAICMNPSAVSPWCVSAQAPSAATIREILYGNSQTGRNGAITRIQKYLVGQRATALSSVPPDQKALDSIEPKLQATREAIRQNWENLENSLFAEHDLRGIELYEARLRGAYFGAADLSGANLCGADLSRANFEHANMDAANLSAANLNNLYGWREVKSYRGTNLFGITEKTSPPGFLEYARKDGAVQLPLAKWKDYIRQNLKQNLPSWTVYARCP